MIDIKLGKHVKLVGARGSIRVKLPHCPEVKVPSTCQDRIPDGEPAPASMCIPTSSPPTLRAVTQSKLLRWRWWGTQVRGFFLDHKTHLTRATHVPANSRYQGIWKAVLWQGGSMLWICLCNQTLQIVSDAFKLNYWTYNQTVTCEVSIASTHRYCFIPRMWKIICMHYPVYLVIHMIK